MKKKIILITFILLSSLILNVSAEWEIDERWEIDPRWSIGETTEYQLTINSYPINVTFYLNDTSKTTPYDSLKTEATYNITFISSLTIESSIWTFWYWEDNTTNTNPERIIILDEDTSLRAIYTTTNIAQIGEGVFTSGMDLSFIRNDFHFRHSGSTPYGQILLDVSPYENHGYLYPVTTPYSSAERVIGKIGYALEFDGQNDFINITASDSLNMTDAITISSWVYPYNTTGIRKIINKPMVWTLGIKNGYLMTEIVTSDDIFVSSDDIWVNETITEIDINTWYHIAITYSYTDGYYTVYVNGVEEAKISTNGRTLNLNTRNVYIGSHNGTIEFWNGVIDEVKVYSFAQSIDEIKTDMVIPIRKITEPYFTQVYDEDNKWTKGLRENYTGFNTGDVDLPYAQSNSTFEDVTIESIRFIVGFSKYRYYCTIKNNSTYNAWNQHDFYWNFELFKNGILQTAYIMKAQIIREATGNYTASRFWFNHYVNGSWTEDLFEYLYFDRELPEDEGVRIVMDAWIGSDSKHFTMRLALENTTDGEEYYLQYSFSLTDYEGNPKHISWFDGWIVFTVGINNRSYDVWSVPSLAEISEHGWFSIDTIIRSLIVGAGQCFAVRYVLSHGAGYPLPSSPLAGGLAGLFGSEFGHQLIGAFNTALSPVIEAFRPLTDAFLNVGNSIVQSFINFLGQISIAIIDGFDTLGLYVFGIDEMFSSFVDGASIWLGQIGALAGHMTSYIAGFIGFMINIGSGIGQSISGFFSLIAYSLSNSSANILGQITGLFSYLDQLWNGTGVFEGAVPFREFWLLFSIAFLGFIGLGIANNGFGWFLGLLEQWHIIIDFIKGIVMFGFNLLQKIIVFIRSLIPI